MKVRQSGRRPWRLPVLGPTLLFAAAAACGHASPAAPATDAPLTFVTLHNVSYTRTRVTNPESADRPPDAFVVQLCVPGGTKTLEIAAPDACLPGEFDSLRVACSEPGWWNAQTATWTIPTIDVPTDCSHQIYVSDRARWDPTYPATPNATDLVGDRIAIDGRPVRTESPDCGLLLPLCAGAVFGFFQVLADGTIK